MIVSINGERVDVRHRVALVLKNIAELGGEANTRDVTRRSGLQDWEVREAAEQAADRGFVEHTGYDSASYGPGSDPRLYELTGIGRQVVQRDIPSKVIRLQQTDATTPEKDLEDIQETIERLEKQVDEAKRVVEVERRLERLRQKLNGEGGLSDEEVHELREEVESLARYFGEMKNWLFALRAIVERELDVDLDDELD